MLRHQNRGYLKILLLTLVPLLVVIGCKSSAIKGISYEKYKPAILENFGEVNPNAPAETMQFGQLVGEWECISKDLDTSDEGNPIWYSNKALWKWEYALGGHAILNKWWQEDRSPNATIKEYFATGIFIFNPKSNLWEMVVLNSKPHKISPKFQAEYIDNTLQMHDGTGKWLVTFFDVKQNSFMWKYEVANEDGSWKSISEISAIRKK